LFEDGKGKLRKELTVDGVHLDEHGYKIWAENLKRHGYI